MRKLAGCALAMVAAVACKSSKSTDSGTTPPTPPVDTGSAAPTPTGTDAPPAPAPDPAAIAAGRQVVLAGNGETMYQIGCWSPAAKGLIDDDSCLDGAPDKVEVIGRNGEKATSSKKSEEQYCAISDEEPESAWAFTVAADGVAVWPADAPVKLVTPTGQPASKAQIAAATAAMRKPKEWKKWKLDAIEVVPVGDLDGDGKPDLVIDVHGALPMQKGTDLATQVSGLFVDWGDGKLVEMQTDTGTPTGNAEISAALDLGADGRTELVVAITWNGGYATRLLSYGTDRKLKEIGSIGCDS